MEIALDNIRQAEGILDNLTEIKEIIENKINLDKPAAGEKRIILPGNKIMRICLLVGLYQSEKRNLEDVATIQLSKTSSRIHANFFTHMNLRPLFSALLKLRYNDYSIDWTDNPLVSRIIASEMYRGRDFLMKDNNLDNFMFSAGFSKSVSNGIPSLDLAIGTYGDDIEAKINISSTQIANTQILVAGATGSGKTNLLAVLINQFRSLSVETPYPVNFLLFDYKGEFSDPANNSWLSKFDVDRTAILDPIMKPLPVNPFKDFVGKPINEIVLYSTEMANALCAIDRATISSKMSNRLSEAIIEAYKQTKGAPISFSLMLEKYQERMEKAGVEDSVTSVLKQLERSRLFDAKDSINLIEDCYIIKMDSFPKDGPIAKAIVYFIISKLNNIYEGLEQQAKDDKNVQIRHFTIIDEAHYMLDFDNRPLRNLIAVGRNKGLSIILATQNMESFKSKHFDFYANAQYPLIMKQQTINDAVLKDLFGVSGRDLQDLRSAVAGLQKGEIIIKDNIAAILGLGKSWKKAMVTHLI